MQLSYCNLCRKKNEMTMYLPSGMMIVSLISYCESIIDYELTIRYDDSLFELLCYVPLSRMIGAFFCVMIGPCTFPHN